MNELDIELIKKAGFILFDEYSDAMQNSLKLLVTCVRADEREACALICDEHADDPVYCGAAIRARGNT